MKREMGRKFVRQLKRTMWVQRGFNLLIDKLGNGQEYQRAAHAAIELTKVLVEAARDNAATAANESKGWALVYSDRPGEIKDDLVDEAAALMLCGDLAEAGLDVRPVLLGRRGDPATAHFVVMFGWEHNWRLSADLQFPPAQVVRHLA